MQSGRLPSLASNRVLQCHLQCHNRHNCCNRIFNIVLRIFMLEFSLLTSIALLSILYSKFEFYYKMKTKSFKLYQNGFCHYFFLLWHTTGDFTAWYWYLKCRNSQLLSCLIRMTAGDPHHRRFPSRTFDGKYATPYPVWILSTYKRRFFERNQKQIKNSQKKIPKKIRTETKCNFSQYSICWWV